MPGQPVAGQRTARREVQQRGPDLPVARAQVPRAFEFQRDERRGLAHQQLLQRLEGATRRNGQVAPPGVRRGEGLHRQPSGAVGHGEPEPSPQAPLRGDLVLHPRDQCGGVLRLRGEHREAGVEHRDPAVEVAGQVAHDAADAPVHRGLDQPRLHGHRPADLVEPLGAEALRHRSGEGEERRGEGHLQHRQPALVGGGEDVAGHLRVRQLDPEADAGRPGPGEVLDVGAAPLRRRRQPQAGGEHELATGHPGTGVLQLRRVHPADLPVRARVACDEPQAQLRPGQQPADGRRHGAARGFRRSRDAARRLRPRRAARAAAVGRPPGPSAPRPPRRRRPACPAASPATARRARTRSSPRPSAYPG